MKDWQAPISSSTMLHGVQRMEAAASPANSGAVTVRFENDGYEAFSLTVFTESANLSIELAAAINAVLAKHNRLVGQINDAAEEAA